VGANSKQALILALAVVAPVAGAQDRTPLPVSAYEIHFDQQLGLPDELRLRYTNDSRSVDFRCESDSQPITGSALHLFLAHGPHVSSDRSFLSVSLNYGVVRSLRLDLTNQHPTEVVIPIAPNLLHQENRLTFSVEQHYPDGAPLESMWTSILARSYFTIQAIPALVPRDLRRLPLPLLDPNSYQPKALDVLLPRWIAPPTLEATALFVANLVHRVAPAQVSVKVITTIAEARNPLLIVGTPYEQPELRSVHAVLPAHGDEGLAGVIPRVVAKSPPVVFVTGGSPEGVNKAARRLALTGVSGNLVRIASQASYKPATPHAWKGFIPPTGRFTLADLGIKQLTIGPENDYSLVLPLDAPPDFRFFPNGAQMTLHLRMEPGFHVSTRRLLIELNGVRLRDLDLGGIPGESSLSVAASVPGTLLKSQNRLTISLQNQSPTAEAPASAMLLPNSQFTFPGDYGAELPDLALLRFHLYPFSRNPDLSDLVIAVPTVVDRGIFEAVVELADNLGRLAPGDRLAFRLKQMGGSQDPKRDGSQVINLGLFSQMGQAWPAVREAVSESDGRKFVLNIEASSNAALKLAIEQFFAEPVLKRLSGDTGFLTTHGLTSLTTTRRINVYETLLLLHLEAWLRTDWLALPLILTAVSTVLFVVWRLTLGRYKSRNPRWQSVE
jgi:hypothetical protein